MGSIIGKGGKLISDLRSESGAFIKAFPTKLQNCDERVLLIKGEVDKIINALSRIYGKSTVINSYQYDLISSILTIRFERIVYR